MCRCSDNVVGQRRAGSEDQQEIQGGGEQCLPNREGRCWGDLGSQPVC